MLPSPWYFYVWYSFEKPSYLDRNGARAKGFSNLEVKGPFKGQAVRQGEIMAAFNKG